MLYLGFSFSLYNHFELGLKGVDYDLEFSDVHCVLSASSQTFLMLRLLESSSKLSLFYHVKEVAKEHSIWD